MRKYILFHLILYGAVFLGISHASLVVTGLQGDLILLDHMYQRDTVLAYEQGFRRGEIEGRKPLDLTVDALAILYDRYPKAAPRHYAEWTVAYAIKWGVPTLVLAGMIIQESSCDPNAISSVGAKGLTQIIWKYWGEKLIAEGIAEKEDDLFNPRISIEAGAYVFRYYLDKYDGSMELALDAYSGGAKGYVEKVIRRVVG